MQKNNQSDRHCSGRKRKYPWEKLDKVPYCFVWSTSPRKNRWDDDRRRIWTAGRSMGIPVICRTTDDKKAIIVTRKMP
jgi:hypothetical protein